MKTVDTVEYEEEILSEYLQDLDVVDQDDEFVIISGSIRVSF